MTVDPLEALVADLRDAQASAGRVMGAGPLGVRAVEPARGQRWYLCAFDGPRMLCLDARMVPERDARSVRQAAACALLVEHAEGLVEQGELDVLAGAASTLATQVEAAALSETLSGLQTAAAALAVWRAAPGRAIASLGSLDVGIQLHDEVRRHYERFIEGSEPLVAIQDRLSDELIAALRDVDEAAGRAGVGRPLAAALAEAMEALDVGADEMLSLHATPVE